MPTPFFAVPITNLQRREIEAGMAAALLRQFTRLLGEEKTIQAATDAIRQNALETGRKMAERYGCNDLATLARIVAEVWAENGALEYRILEHSDKMLSFDVHRCLYAELYEDMGVKEFGTCLSCCRDEPFATGFNPRIKLFRSKTIMEGADLCDFRFSLE